MLRYWIPLLPVSAPESLYCSFNSKSAGLPPRQIQKIFCWRLVIGLGLADHRAVLHAKEIRIAVPAFQALPVEDGLEAGLLHGCDPAGGTAASTASALLPRGRRSALRTRLLRGAGKASPARQTTGANHRIRELLAIIALLLRRAPSRERGP